MSPRQRGSFRATATAEQLRERIDALGRHIGDARTELDLWRSVLTSMRGTYDVGDWVRGPDPKQVFVITRSAPDAQGRPKFFGRRLIPDKPPSLSLNEQLLWTWAEGDMVVIIRAKDAKEANEKLGLERYVVR